MRGRAGPRVRVVAGIAAERLQEAHAGLVARPVIGCGANGNPEPRGSLAPALGHGAEIGEPGSRALRAVPTGNAIHPGRPGLARTPSEGGSHPSLSLGPPRSRSESRSHLGPQAPYQPTQGPRERRQGAREVGGGLDLAEGAASPPLRGPCGEEAWWAGAPRSDPAGGRPARGRVRARESRPCSRSGGESVETLGCPGAPVLAPCSMLRFPMSTPRGGHREPQRARARAST